MISFRLVRKNIELGIELIKIDILIEIVAWKLMVRIDEPSASAANLSFFARQKHWKIRYENVKKVN